MIFKDRYHAGLLLSQKLLKYKNRKNVLILGIPRGGVVVAKTISTELNLPLDIIVTKKIGAPGNEEHGIGAVGPKGIVLLDLKRISYLGISKEYIEEEAVKKSDEIVRRIVEYKSSKNADIDGKAVILVDDGIATGVTVEVAIKYLKTNKIKKLVLATPVLPRSSVLKFGKLVEELVFLEAPNSFGSVGQFYQHFPQVTDEEVVSLLKSSEDF